MNRLITALREAPPALLLPGLANEVAKKSELKLPVTAEILKLLSTLDSVRTEENTPLDEFVDQVCIALKETKLKGLQPEGNNWEDFKQNLSQALSMERSLGVTSKALSVMTRHARVFKDAQVLTDLRAVFQSDPTKSPAAAVVIHNLRITFFENERWKEFFVALDSNDLRQLQSVLSRALKKEESLKSVVNKAGLRCLDPTTH